MGGLYRSRLEQLREVDDELKRPVVFVGLEPFWDRRDAQVFLHCDAAFCEPRCSTHCSCWRAAHGLVVDLVTTLLCLCRRVFPPSLRCQMHAAVAPESSLHVPLLPRIASALR